MTSIADLTEKSREMHLDNLKELKSARTLLLEAVEQEKRMILALQKAARKDADSHRLATQNYEVAIDELLQKMSRLTRDGGAIATAQKVLKSLQFREMRIRHAEIREAYKDTYEWIFSQEKTPFKSWLRDDSGIFWISGKAGSGKSTLMKYIADHDQTQAVLKQWAGDRPLVVASFYFWNSGYRMQKSQEGLLQGLLYQILHQHPELIPQACPERWRADAAFHDNPDPWDRKELSQTFQRIFHKGHEMVDAALRFQGLSAYDQMQLATGVANVNLGMEPCFSFFIDGLDEYSGDHHELICDLNRLAQSPAVKLCVSSRPWNAFKNAYGSVRRRSLIMQDLNRDDMGKYVKGVLEEDNRFLRLRQEDHRADIFATEVREKAQGVFLWVFLVVRSLLRGMTEADGIDMLLCRLRELPSDLEEYFRHIVQSIDSSYNEFSARAFQIAANAARPLPLMTFHYLVDDVKNPGSAVDGPLTPWKASLREKHRGEAIANVNKWCRDLLEVNKSPFKEVDDPILEYKVDFMHRTVRDFLMTTDMQRLFECRSATSFNPRSAICYLFLAQAKSLNVVTGYDEDMQAFVSLAQEIMCYAKEVELFEGVALSSLLVELDRVGCHYRGPGRRPHWTEVTPQDRPSAEKALAGGSNFLAYAVDFDLHLFVQATLASEPAKIRKFGRPLLAYTLRPTFSTSLSPRSELSCDMLEVLLINGANLGEVSPCDHDELTLWELLLHQCNSSPKSNEALRLAHIALQTKPDLSCRIVLTGKASRSVSVLGCLEHICPSKDTKSLRLLYAKAEEEARKAGDEAAEVARATKEWWYFWRWIPSIGASMKSETLLNATGLLLGLTDGKRSRSDSEVMPTEPPFRTRIIGIINEQCAKQGSGLVVRMSQPNYLGHCTFARHRWTREELSRFARGGELPCDISSIGEDMIGRLRVFDTDNAGFVYPQLELHPHDVADFEKYPALCAFDADGEGDIVLIPSVDFGGKSSVPLARLITCWLTFV